MHGNTFLAQAILAQGANHDGLIIQESAPRENLDDAFAACGGFAYQSACLDFFLKEMYLHRPVNKIMDPLWKTGFAAPLGEDYLIANIFSPWTIQRDVPKKERRRYRNQAHDNFRYLEMGADNGLLDLTLSTSSTN